MAFAENVISFDAKKALLNTFKIPQNLLYKSRKKGQGLWTLKWISDSYDFVQWGYGEYRRTIYEKSIKWVYSL